MSFLNGQSTENGQNAQNGQNGQNGQNAQNDQSAFAGAHVGGLASPLLSTALARARDSIVGTEMVTGTLENDFAKLPEDERFARLTGDFRGAVLATELAGDMTFHLGKEDGDPHASAVTALVGTSGDAGDDSKQTVTFKKLATLERPTDPDFERDLALVANYADLRGDRLAEIHTQITDVTSFFGAIGYIHATRSKWTLEVLSTGLDMATMVAQRMKLALACPRPIVFSDKLQPMIQTPTHGTFPSGHATQAFLLATLLSELESGKDGAKIDPASQLFRMASRIAINRTVAGVHFPSDSAAGAVLGVTLGQYLAARARGAGQETPARVFKGAAYKNGDTGRDFHYAEFDSLLGDDDPAMGKDAGKVPVREAPLWSWIWGEAQDEWNQRWT